ncbi:carboxymuconolactone decarboxylase family protein [Croceicoccus sp. F390]|uniref:Carboxymuconolactone decarboxylase family protein n=1 Tax=Croceicoccus esteveae TaxID=3075597 RepID=A0ABU2ZIG3_9SPHN|nr:carboxymuconolactone decarboxylase family protein [Croceicoccus sp. F390]MDT0575369.1 carboxymuconolactone decarboxylase family protein [Croceicoccus sp. F390]
MQIQVPHEHAHEPYGFAARTLAPDIMTAAGAFSEAVYGHSSLSLREFEGARVRTAQINGCVICQGFRAARDLPSLYSGRLARSVIDNGDAPDEAFYEAAQTGTRSPLFSAREWLAIQFAERFGTEPKALAADAEFWTQMHECFSDAEIVDLAHCVAAWTGLGRVAHVLGFDEVCLVPQHAEA